VSCESKKVPYTSSIHKTHSISLLFICEVSALGNWLSTFRNKRSHTSPWNQTLLYISALEYKTKSWSRNLEYRLASNSASYIIVTDGQKERLFLCAKAETVRCRAFVCFVVTDFRMNTNNLGLYFNVNTQVMKLDRVSELC